MNRAPSKSKAALWMAGWLSLMLVVVVAGREAMAELNVFQIVMRSPRKLAARMAVQIGMVNSSATTWPMGISVSAKNQPSCAE